MSRTELSEIWYTRCPVATPLGLADRLGYLEEDFAREGIAIRSVIDSPDRDIRRSHFEHTLDFSFRHGGNVPPIRARSEGRRTRLVGITWTDEFQSIITRPDTGIRTAADLRGRQIGIPRRPAGIVDFLAASALKGVVSALQLGGLTLADAEIVDIAVAENVLDRGASASTFGLDRRVQFGAELTALARGEVDAIYVKGPVGLAGANLIGAREVVDLGWHPDPAIRINTGVPRLLTVDERLAEERPDLVVLLLASIRRASAWARGNPDEVRRIVARESQATEEQVLAAHGPDLHKHLEVGLEPELIAAVSSFKDFLRDHGFLAADFDVAEWADHRPYAALSAKAA